MQTLFSIKTLIILLSSAVISSIISYISSKSSSYVATITAERVKWINGLRLHAAKFFMATAALHRSETKGGELRKQEVDKEISIIIMSLNPDDIVAQKIIDKIRKIPEIIINHSNDYKKYEADLIELFQLLFKQEWEEVKREALGFWQYIKILKWHYKRYKFRKKIENLLR